MPRKVHNTEPGYIAERKNPYLHPKATQKVVIYIAAEQGIDVGDCKYAVVCDAHGTICGATSIPSARTLMKSVEFCEECMRIAKSKFEILM